MSDDFCSHGRSKSKRRRRFVRKLTVLVGGAGGAIRTFHGRLAWALDCLIKAGEIGVTPLEWPAPRWSQYILLLRRHRIAIETALERHGGPYAGRRGRYVLRSPVEIIDREDRR